MPYLNVRSGLLNRGAALLVGAALLWGAIPLLWGGQPALAQKDEGTTEVKSVSISPADQSPALSVETEIENTTGDDVLEAGEEATLKVTLRNQGDGAARRVEVWASPERPHPGLRLMGEAPPNDTGAVRLARLSKLDPLAETSISGTLKATPEVDGGRVPIRIDLRGQNGFASKQPTTPVIDTKAYRPPSLALVGYETGRERRQDKISPDTTSEVRIQVKNAGSGSARDIEAQLEAGANGSLRGPATRALGTVEPGGSTTVPVSLFSQASGSAVTVRLTLRSSPGPYEKTVQVKVPVAAPVDRAIPQTDVTRPNAVAVVIGNKTYRNEDIPHVKYAARDARVVKKYLTRTLGVRSENVIHVEGATAADLTRVFGTADDPQGQLYNYVQPGESEVFVYYSGHGAPSLESSQAYLVPSDADPNYLSQNGYLVGQLYENLATIPAKSVTVMLEACFSGVSEGGAVVQRASPVELSVENPVMAMENGLAFTAGAADQIASWYPEKKHGLFTYFFLKGLRGPADEDGDQAITGAEMEKYLTEKVPYRAQRTYNREQTPQVVGQARNRVLVRYAEEVPLD
jgi:uncharacterized caspase-like protein